MRQPKPIFSHDCDLCRFLGSVSVGNRWGDLYICERYDDVSMRSVIFRTSSDGPDYNSAPMSMAATFPHNHPLRLAAGLCAKENFT